MQANHPGLSERRFPPIGRIILVLFFKRTERPFGRRTLFLLLESDGIVNALGEAIYKMDSCSARQAEQGILWPDKILRLFRWSGHVLVESIPVVDLALKSSNDKLARSVPALLANFIQLSNDSGWEILVIS